MSNWKEQREADQAARATRRLNRLLAAPPARGEMLRSSAELQQHVASVALGLEALESLLIQRGILAENDLMGALEALLKVKAEQIAASEALERGQKGAD